MKKYFLKTLVFGAAGVFAVLAAYHQADAGFISEMFGLSAPRNMLAASSSSSTYNLKVYKSGQGAVTSNDGKINCGQDCREKYSTSISVTLTAAADPGFYFYKWSYDCSGASVACELSMNKSHKAKAYFKKEKKNLPTGSQSDKKPSKISDGSSSGDASSSGASSLPSGMASYKLKINKTGSGKVMAVANNNSTTITCGGSDSKKCEGMFAEGVAVTLSAIAGSNHLFGTWEGDCASVNIQTSSCTLIMKRDMKVSATFNKNNGGTNISVRMGGNGSGTVKTINFKGESSAGINCGNDCSENYAGNLQLKAYPASGSVMGSWSGCNTYESAKDQCLAIADGGDSKLVTVSFYDSDSKFNLSVKANGSGTIKSDDGKINCGSSCKKEYGSEKEVRLTAEPSSGYAFSYWKSCYNKLEGNVCTVKMDREREIEAFFVKTASPSVVTGDVTVTVEQNSARATLKGTVNPAGSEGKASFMYWKAGNQMAESLMVTPYQSVSGTGDKKIEAEITGLEVSTEYSYQLSFDYGGKTVSGSEKKFTAAASDSNASFIPVVISATARNITSTSALLEAKGDTNGTKGVKVWFEYWTDGIDSVNTGSVKSTGKVNMDDTGSLGKFTDSFSIAKLTPNTEYAYHSKLSYIDSSTGREEFKIGPTQTFRTLDSSETSSATPATPANFNATTGACGAGKITLSWNDVSNETQYIVSKTDRSGYEQAISVGKDSVSYTDTTVANFGVDFIYKVKACNGGSANCSAYTSAKTVTSPVACGNDSSEAVSAYKLKITVSGTGEVEDNYSKISCDSNMSCQATYSKGQIVRLKTDDTDSDGKSFGTKVESWSGGGCSGTSNSCDVTMDSDKDITIKFVPK